jgi:hypothetical protein
MYYLTYYIALAFLILVYVMMIERPAFGCACLWRGIVYCCDEREIWVSRVDMSRE